MRKENCTVLINSCDSYEDLWNPFFKLFKTYWKNCPYEVVLNTETKQFFDNEIDIRIVNYPSIKKDNYGKRMRNCLKSIKTPYVILLLDDFFLREPVDEAFIEKIVDYLDNNPDVICFNFDVANDKYDVDDGRFLEFRKRSLYGEYKYNMQAAIWRTQELYAAWKPNESPWQWELYGNVRSWTEEKLIYILKEEIKTPLEYGYYPAARGVYRGKWVLEDVKPLFDANEISIDYEIRGIYSEIDESKPRRYVIIPKLYSYGVWRYFHYVLWYIIRRVFKFGDNGHNSMSYSEDMNYYYYTKGGR